MFHHFHVRYFEGLQPARLFSFLNSFISRLSPSRSTESLKCVSRVPREKKKRGAELCWRNRRPSRAHCCWLSLHKLYKIYRVGASVRARPHFFSPLHLHCPLLFFGCLDEGVMTTPSCYTTLYILFVLTKVPPRCPTLNY